MQNTAITRVPRLLVTEAIVGFVYNKTGFPCSLDGTMAGSFLEPGDLYQDSESDPLENVEEPGPCSSGNTYHMCAFHNFLHIRIHQDACGGVGVRNLP